MDEAALGNLLKRYLSLRVEVNSLGPYSSSNNQRVKVSLYWGDQSIFATEEPILLAKDSDTISIPGGEDD